MDDREQAQILGLVRLVAGLATFLMPRTVAKLWLGDRADSSVARVALRGVGVRDAAIGTGLLLALEDGGKQARPWLQAGALVDAADSWNVLVDGEMPLLRRLISAGATGAFAWWGLMVSERVD
ncbi:MAG TPA: hypothetical protein VNC78_10830 [Actinomycetota bacterium]|nr:hypothetical protein [Actinomycetota bacterium]